MCINIKMNLVLNSHQNRTFVFKREMESVRCAVCNKWGMLPHTHYMFNGKPICREGECSKKFFQTLQDGYQEEKWTCRNCKKACQGTVHGKGAKGGKYCQECVDKDFMVLLDN